MASSFISFSLLFISLCTADGFRSFGLDICDFNSTDLKNIEFIRSQYYNKVEIYRFSSSVGKFVGFTEYGLKQAEYWNNNPSILAQLRGEKERYCLNHIQAWYSHTLDKSAEPYVVLSSVTPPGGHHPSMLVCSVFDFYPQHIKLSSWSVLPPAGPAEHLIV
ncbi:HLA class II histocompatibility antigen, DRB1-15 beta chain [Larimichthys crocea]|nr:HLA class II histocompatibility antigen, DRB1-15 beta chain [Larimichthys crocea]